MRVACDTGGTFTDLIIEEHCGLKLFKTSTTPLDPVQGVLNGLNLIAKSYDKPLDLFLGNVDTFIHATTRSINAVLTGNTAKTAFFTTKGHKDILLLREGGRTDPFNFTNEFPSPLVPRSLTFEIAERILSSGEIFLEIDEKSVENAIFSCLEQRVEAIGVCLMWSIANPVHEKKIGEMVTALAPNISVTLSSELNPSLREYRRANSACLDASLKPLMFNYLDGLENRMKKAGFQGRVLMVTSQGGVMEASDVARSPIHSLGSGPAMAPIAGAHFADKSSGDKNVIIADTGGTSYDVSLVRDGKIPWTRETWLGQKFKGHMTGFPSVDVKSIGAGGGSIAWVDEGGLLHVGPKSAGSSPGPVCYGAGGVEPTVTDCSLALGFIDPNYFLGGSMALDQNAAENAIKKMLAEPLNMSIEEVALSVLALATEKMVGAIEEITVNQGIDPKKAVLVGGGGAAGLNANAVARRLGCKRAIIPGVGAALSASGALISDLSAEYAKVLFTETDCFKFEEVNQALAELTKKCEKFIKKAGFTLQGSFIEYFVEARYPSQIWEIDTPVSKSFFANAEDVESLRNDFHKAHEAVFEISDRSSHVEFVNWRAKVSCRIRDSLIDQLQTQEINEFAPKEKRLVFFEQNGWTKTQVLSFDDPIITKSIKGPAIVESSFTTVVVEPNSVLSKDSTGSLIIEV